MLIMPETGFHPTPREDRNTWQHMWHTFNQGVKAVRSRPRLMNIVFIGLFYGLYSEGFDRLWVKHLLDNFELPVLFGNNQVAFFAVLTRSRRPAHHSRCPLCGEARRFNQFACHRARRAGCDRNDFGCIDWICALAASFVKPGPVSRDQCFAQCSDPAADCLDQPETGFAGTRHRPFDVRTGGCHRSGTGWTGCRGDRFRGFSRRFACDLGSASDARALLHRTRQLAVQRMKRKSSRFLPIKNEMLEEPRSCEDLVS